jgi:hypothetical protein
VGQLTKKITRLLNNYLFSVKKERGMLVSGIRLWRVDFDSEDLRTKLSELDSKYPSYTHLKVNAKVLNLSEE